MGATDDFSIVISRARPARAGFLWSQEMCPKYSVHVKYLPCAGLLVECEVHHKKFLLRCSAHVLRSDTVGEDATLYEVVGKGHRPTFLGQLGNGKTLN